MWTWIKCTDEHGQTIHVNLDNVITLFRDEVRPRGTIIAFVGGARLTPSLSVKRPKKF